MAMDTSLAQNEPEEHISLLSAIKQEAGEVEPSNAALETNVLLKEEISIDADLLLGEISNLSAEDLSENAQLYVPTLELHIKEEFIADEIPSTSDSFAYAISNDVEPQKLYKCRICSFKCYLFKHYMWHSKHHKQHCNKCEQCGQETKTKSEFTSHINQHHLNVFPCHSHLDVYKPILNSNTEVELEAPAQALHIKVEAMNTHKCKHCDFATSVEESLTLHVKETHPLVKNYIYKCRFCNYTAWKLAHYNKHKNRSHRPKFRKTKKYLCECGFKTATKLTLNLHRKRHELEQKCQFCEFTGAQLHRHMRSKHTEEKPYKCFHCSFTTVTSYRLNRHLETHLPKVQCNECEKSFTTNAGLISHKQAHVSGNYCHRCRKFFKTALALLNHTRRHSKQTLYKCQLCRYSTKRSGCLSIHMRSHTGEKPYLCTDCGFQTAYRSHLTRHQQASHDIDQKPYACDECEYVGREKRLLARHKTIHTSERLFKCKQCESSFKNQSALLRHIPIHSKEKLHKCSLCSYSAVRHNSLKIHMRVHTGEKPYSCPDCEYCTAYKGHIKLHQQRVHLKLKPYHCSLCDFSATVKGQLTRHMLNHSGERSYKCGDCNFTSVNNRNLKAHRLQAHEGVAPYQCAHCDFNTMLKACLASHMRTHFEKKLACDECDYACAYQSHLDEHKEQHCVKEDYVEVKCEYSGSDGSDVEGKIKQECKNEGTFDAESATGSFTERNVAGTA